MAAADSKKPADDQNGDEPKVQPLSPAKRKLLQTQFEQGSKLVTKGNFDYANSMFTYCVAGDPGNLIYTKNFLENLLRKYNNNKKGGKLAGMWGAGAKSSMNKCRRKKDWPGVVKYGLDYLKLNPWESSVLTEIAAALAELGFDDCRLEYLKVALSASPTDVELNKQAALAFEDVADFDNAIRCWERIAQQRPTDDQARRTINHLTVQKTIHKGNYEEAESSRDAQHNRTPSGEGPEDDATPEVKFRRDIRRKPEEVTNYIALSDYYWKLEDFENAEKVMHEAVAATGNIRAREHLEDVQLGRTRRNVELARLKAAEDKTEKSTELFKRMKVELNHREMEIYGGRCERYPNNFSLKYDFGLRLRLAGKYREAISQLQAARSEPKRVAHANLELGFCFYKLNRYDLALASFDAAVKSSGQWFLDVKKQALYNAGRLARDLKDYEAAVNYFTELAGLEYGYKDVAELLESSTKLRDQGAA
ncbi:MAG: tetratricopeptide repeat protein [Planctomycetes bacterium]|nr:tetratricopeptide repeat protein [Planctomycetota bacterium]